MKPSFMFAAMVGILMTFAFIATAQDSPAKRTVYAVPQGEVLYILDGYTDDPSQRDYLIRQNPFLESRIKDDASCVFSRIVENANQQGQFIVFLPKGKELKGLQELGVTLRRLPANQYYFADSSAPVEKPSVQSNDHKLPVWIVVVCLILLLFLSAVALGGMVQPQSHRED